MHVAKAGRIASHRRCLSGSMPAKLHRVVPALSTTGARRSGDHRPSWAIVGCRASSEALRIRLTQRAAIMLGTTMPTPMYALYAERMHFAVFTTTVVFAI
jgi:hypothetical protein